MKHFEIKNNIAGSKGGGSKPKPPVLKPPQIGDYSVAASFSYSESVDLLSDGPIEGLVNSNGYVLNPESYMQGLYLNDTPVEITNENFVQRYDDAVLEFDVVEGGAIDCFSSGLSRSHQALDDHEDALYKHTSYRFKYVNKILHGWSRYNKRKQEKVLKTYTYQNPINQNSKKVLISQFPNPSVFSKDNKQESPEGESQYACIDISQGSNYSGVAVRYSTNESMSLDEARYKYAFTASPDTVEKEQKWNGYYTNYSYHERRYGTESANERYLKPIVDKTISKKIACGGTIFFEKQCKDLSNEDTIYSEICLQFSKWKKSLDKGSPEGVFRKKISDSVDQLINEINVDKTRSQGLSSEYLRLSLENLGISTDINQEDGSISPITREQIVEFSKSSLTSEADIKNDIFNEYVFPYSFVSYDPDKVIEGYIQSEHEEIFRDVNFVESIKPNTAYVVGENFYYGDKYYSVIAGFSSPAQITEAYILSLIDNTSIIEIDAPLRNLQDYLSIEPKSLSQRGEYLGQRINLLIPVLDSEGLWNGKVKGFYMEILNVESTRSATVTDKTRGKKTRFFRSVITDNTIFYINFLMGKEEINYNKNIEGLAVFNISERQSAIQGGIKYNYSNIMMEFRNGEQNQTPLSYFRNIFIDHFYNSKLLGPFNVLGERVGFGGSSFDYRGVQKLIESNDLKKENGVSPKLNFNPDSIPPMKDNFLLADKEGSSDNRNAEGEGGGNKAYHLWNKSKIDYNEKAQPIKHIIANPNVSSCFVTVSVEALLDTAEDTGYKGGELGSRIPAPLNIMIETGLINNKGVENVFVRKFFQIVALVETPNYMDIGNPDSRDSILEYKDIREVNRDVETVAEGGIDKPFLLPDIPYSEVREDTAHKEDEKDRRYIKVTKLSTESNSTLIQKNISLIKVTEIIDSQCTYPFSAIVGTKVDSRVFNEIPKRTYRGKFKKINIPSNYNPIFKNGKDKRYYQNLDDYAAASSPSKQIYDGDWDGTFKYGWSDNPAWILYDMILSDRYGLGQQLSESEVNKWELYSIGRFCDAVDDEGYFVGASDARGGLEPRFSCNIAFSQNTKIYDAINSIAAIFRGIVYFSNGSVSFSDDRIKEPIALFTNSNVKDGSFSYSSYKRDEKFNAVEISYKDRNDDYKSKVEYVENEKDIIERGVFKKEIVAAGITSKAMAIRAAKHVMYQTTKENESVSFEAGNECLLCKPGDLIIIEDDLKTLRNNIGRVLEVNKEECYIRTSEPFNATENLKEVTVYIPTGNITKEELDLEASLKRKRLSEFKISADISNLDFKSNFDGLYTFDRYSDGYSENYIEDNIELELYQQYALYKGSQNQFLWFDTQATGWVFSTGKALDRSNEYNMFITNTGEDTFSFKSLTRGIASSVSGFVYDTSSLNSRSGVAEVNFSGAFQSFNGGDDLDYQGGVENERINVNGNSQIRKFAVTGWGGFKGQQSENFGDKIYIDKNDINADLVKFIPEGSTYRFKSKEFSDQVFKISSIKENEDYSYNVLASKYHSGKYEEIENGYTSVEEEELFDYVKQDFKINDINYITLKEPEPELTIKTDEEEGQEFYYLEVEWEPVESATGYYHYFEKPNGTITDAQVSTETFASIEPDLIGRYGFKIQALADTFNNEDYNNRYFDSKGVSKSITVTQVVDEPSENEGVTTSEITIEE